MYKIEMFYTTLTTVDNKHVIIPNGKLSNSTIINVTAQALRLSCLTKSQLYLAWF